MVNFPILEHLEIRNYGLFPGTKDEPGLTVDFLPGMTLVVGANGLGKTTLVSILFRMLAGPFDIPALLARSTLGGGSLVPKALQTSNRRTFGNRVADGAIDGSARLLFALAERKVLIGRRLRDLSLTVFEVDGRPVVQPNEQTFQEEISRLVGVWSFGDWILLLRHLVFYFEDRRALVWDPSAQRQILRFLFLPAARARKWTEDERAILEMDSRVRNLSAALYREQQDLAQNEGRVEESKATIQNLRALEESQTKDHEQVTQLNEQVLDLEVDRQNLRLRRLKAEQERESRFREFERAKLVAIGARLPDHSETARYILAQLMTEGSCLVCGHVAVQAAANYSNRIAKDLCVICGSPVEPTGGPSELADARVDQAHDALERAEIEFKQSARLAKESEARFQTHIGEIQELNTRMSERSKEIEVLVKRLPPAEAEMHRQRSEFVAMRSRIEVLRADLTSKRQQFGSFLEEVNREVVTQSENVKLAFHSYAEGFLLEICKLVWCTRKDTVGEGGASIDFPAYELEMSGTDFSAAVRRTGPEQVSESQREFIDLAFRMALVAAAGSASQGTLVIDAPESSLDAVFVKRAADVLSRFSEPYRHNRLVITSNLVEGRLIPSLVAKGIPPQEKRSRVVDLFEIAAPTAATIRLKEEYDKVKEKLLSSQDGEE